MLNLGMVLMTENYIFLSAQLMCIKKEGKFLSNNIYIYIYSITIYIEREYMLNLEM